MRFFGPNLILTCRSLEMKAPQIYLSKVDAHARIKVQRVLAHFLRTFCACEVHPLLQKAFVGVFASQRLSEIQFTLK